MRIIIHTDGGARGNPGPAAIGVVIEEEGGHRIELSKRIGEVTNNAAEYTAVVEALGYLKSHISLQKDSGQASRQSRQSEPLAIHCYLDSILVVNQLNGTFKVKEPNLRAMLMHIRLLEQEVGGVVRYSYVPRQQNWRADFLVNRALDTSLMSS